MRFKFFILLCMFSYASYGQTEVLFETTKTKTYILDYNTNHNESQWVINDIIRMISDYSSKNLFHTKINFRVDENIKITKHRETVNIRVSYQNISFEGDILYKGFDISPALFPARYEFTGTLKCEVDSANITFKHNKTPFNPVENEVTFFYTDTVKNNRYTYFNDVLIFTYDIENKNRFGQHLQAIDNYYKAEYDLTKSFETISKMNPERFENYEDYMSILNDIGKIINQIDKDLFWSILPLQMYDPRRVKNKIIEVKTLYEDRIASLKNVRNNIHERYFEKGYREYENKKLTDAKISFQKSLSYFPKYAKSQFFLAVIAYDMNNIEESSALLLAMYNFPSIDDETLNFSMNLARNIENYRLNNTEEYLSKGLYNNALKELDLVKQFCTKVPKYSCNDSIPILQMKSHKGIYFNYIQLSQNAFNSGNHSLALNEVDKAISYQNSNNSWINSNEEAMVLKQKINADYYLVLLKDGKNQLQEKYFQSAFNKFQKATEIEANYTVKKDKQLPELLKKAKLELLYIDVQTARTYVQSNNLSKAREILIRIMNEQKEYQLIEQKLLNDQIEGLKKDIFKQECINAQQNYDTKFNMAVKAETEKDYITAQRLYYECLTEADRFRDCAIQTQLSIEGNKRCEIPAKYQKDLITCKKKATQLNYTEATQDYILLSSFFTQNHLETFGLVHPSLLQFFQNYGTDFMRFGADYFTKNNELDQAFVLLTELMYKNDARSSTKKTQQLLAKEMALRDFKVNPNFDYKLKTMEYTKGNKYFKYFSKEYKKAVKKLRK